MVSSPRNGGSDLSVQNIVNLVQKGQRANDTVSSCQDLDYLGALKDHAVASLNLFCTVLWGMGNLTGRYLLTAVNGTIRGLFIAQSACGSNWNDQTCRR